MSSIKSVNGTSEFGIMADYYPKGNGANIVPTTCEFLNSLASDGSPKKIDLQQRRLRKMKERTRLLQKARQQQVRMKKLASEMRTTEAEARIVNQEIQQLDDAIATTMDVEYD